MDVFGQEWAEHTKGCEQCQNMTICPEWLETVKAAQIETKEVESDK